MNTNKKIIEELALMTFGFLILVKWYGEIKLSDLDLNKEEIIKL